MIKKKDMFANALILIIAGVLVKVIGFIYRIPLTNIIGDEGNGYYATAYNIYVIIIMFSSFSIPTTVSKLIAPEIRTGNKKTIRQIFSSAIILSIIIGFTASLLLFGLAGLFVYGNPNALISVQTLAPSIFFSCILGVFRGFFQGFGSMMPTAVSQLIEQLVNALASITLAKVVYNAFVINDATKIPIYGAAAGTIGTTLGTIAALVTVILFYIFQRKGIYASFPDMVDGPSYSRKYVFGQILRNMIPISMGSLLYHSSTLVDMYLFYFFMSVKQISSVDASKLYGIFSGKFLLLVGIPISFSTAIGTSVMPRVASARSANDNSALAVQVREAIEYTLLIAAPSAIGISILAEPIIKSIFTNSDPISIQMLQLGFLSIIMYSLSTITNTILQGIGNFKEYIKNIIISILIQIVGITSLLYFTDINSYALLISYTVFPTIIFMLNLRHLKGTQFFDISTARILKILGSSVLMGLVTFLSYKFINRVTSSSMISAIISVCISAIFYMFMIFVSGLFDAGKVLKRFKR